MDSTAYQAQSGALYAERECSGSPTLNPTGPGSTALPPTGAFYPRPGGYPTFPLLPGRHGQYIQLVVVYPALERLSMFNSTGWISGRIELLMDEGVAVAAGGAVAVTPFPTAVYPPGQYPGGQYAGNFPPASFPLPSPYPPPDRNFPGNFPTGTSTGSGGFGTGFGTGTGFSTGPGGPAGPVPSPFSPKPGAPDPILNPYPCRGTLSYEKVAGATYTPARRSVSIEYIKSTNMLHLTRFKNNLACCLPYPTRGRLSMQSLWPADMHR